MQPEGEEVPEGCIPLLLMIHDATLGQMKDAIAVISALACIREKPVWMRVETLD
jgi:hypothetical protein